MNPNIDYIDEESINRKFASNEQRIEELNAIKEQIQNAKDDLERAKLARKALLNISSKKGMLTKQGSDDLFKLTPAEIHENGEVFFETPLLDENMTVSSYINKK